MACAGERLMADILQRAIDVLVAHGFDPAVARELILAQRAAQARKPVGPLTFEVWLRRVNYAIHSACGLDRDDLPDAPYHRWFTERVKPEAAAKRAIRAARN